MRVNINRFGWNCLKTLETFVWISNHVSRSTTWSPFNLKLDQNDQSKYDVSCGGVILTPSSSQHNFELAYNVLTKLSYCPSFQFLAIFFSVSNFCPIFLNCYLLVIKSFLSCVPVTQQLASFLVEYSLHGWSLLKVSSEHNPNSLAKIFCICLKNKGCNTTKNNIHYTVLDSSTGLF